MKASSVDILIHGFPGYSPSNGGMGWSTVGLVRAEQRIVLIDTGPFGVRDLLRSRLRERGVDPGQVTDVVLTHLHHDHSVNWPMFARARVHVARAEIAWAVGVPPGSSPLPEFSVRELAGHHALSTVEDGDEVAPGVHAFLAPGHTPGSLLVEVDQGASSVIFLGDAAKNRSELLSRRSPHASDAGPDSSIASIWGRWRSRPGTIVVPGHDLPLRLVGKDPRYLEERDAAVVAYLGRSNEETTQFALERGTEGDVAT